jgi:hypothetical protein
LSEWFKLYNLDARDWIRITTEKMENSGKLSKVDWNIFYKETYKELGGKSTSVRNKGCPRLAGYVLWLLGRLKISNREKLKVSIIDIDNLLSKNGAYAILGQEILEKSPYIDKYKLFELIQKEYKKRTKIDPPNQDNGVVTLTWILFKADMLI